jgi:hypothetical protein
VGSGSSLQECSHGALWKVKSWRSLAKADILHSTGFVAQHRTVGFTFGIQHDNSAGKQLGP